LQRAKSSKRVPTFEKKKKKKGGEKSSLLKRKEVKSYKHHIDEKKKDKNIKKLQNHRGKKKMEKGPAFGEKRNVKHCLPAQRSREVGKRTRMKRKRGRGLFVGSGHWGGEGLQVKGRV